MLIELYREPHPNSSLFVKGSDKRLQLPAKDIIVIDTSILLPTIFPLDKTNAHQILGYTAKLHREFEISPRLKRMKRLNCERQLRVSRAIEKEMFKKIGRQPATTAACCNELNSLGRDVGENNYFLWKMKVSSFMYEIRLDIDHFREAYSELSDKLKDNADFSIAMGAYLIGGDFASDDYTSFNTATNNVLKDMYSKRWGNQKRPNRHDSESLCMLLSGI